VKTVSETQRGVWIPIVPDLRVVRDDAPEAGFTDPGRTLAELVWDPDRQTPFAIAVQGGAGQDHTGLLQQARRLLQGTRPRAGARKVQALRFNVGGCPDDDSVLVGLLGALLNAFRHNGLLGRLRFKVDGQHSRLACLLLHTAAPWAFGRPVAASSRQHGDEVQVDKGQFWAVYRDLFQQAAALLLQGGMERAAVPLDEQARRRFALAIFLEDLDRCGQERLLEVVEAIRLFMALPGVVLFQDLDSERLLAVLSEQPAEDREVILQQLVQVTSSPGEVPAGRVETGDRPEASIDATPHEGIEWVEIPAGRFTMGSQVGRDNEQPVQVVSLPAFTIARYPLTNAQYARYVSATGAHPPEHWGDGRIPPGREDHPVVFVSWWEALSFCDWLGEELARQGVLGRVRLPSEAEWEYAARGGAGREYPWGNETPDENRCNFNNYVGDTTPVGAYPAGATPEGVHDLVGNVWEWSRSKWDKYPYPASQRKRDKREAGKGEDTRRVLRGCSFRYSAWYARSACRGNGHPAGRHPRVGFRVVLCRPARARDPDA